MSQITAEQFAQRIHDCRLLDNRQIDRVFSDMGSRNVKLDDFHSRLLQNEFLTNWQILRLMDGHRSGYFYGNWKVLYIVGAGTFARVYRVAHNKTGDVKAAKVLRNRYADDLVTRERFMREARTVMKLRHPNIVPIHEVDNHRGRIYMVMDFIEGQNVRDFLRVHRSLKMMTALEITRDVCSGLDYAQQRGVLHRDIKLSNVLLASTGRASLVDFGLAAADEHISGGVFNPRSVDYAGLEKATYTPRNDKRSDIFFVGCNLYQMISGKPPLFETRERMRRMSPQRYREIEPLSSIMPELPHRVINLVNRMMLLDPEERLQTPREALDETIATIKALKQGDNKRYDEQLSKQEADDYARRTMKVNEGRNRTIMVIESNPTVQDVLRKRLKKIGYRVLILGDPIRALERFKDLDPAEEKPADCVLFGTAGLGMANVEAFNEFVANPIGKEIPGIILVKEERLEDYKEKANMTSHHRMLALPIKFPKIRRALQELLGIEVEARENGENDEVELGLG